MKRTLTNMLQLLPVIGLCGCSVADNGPQSDSQPSGNTQQVVRQIDHILIDSSEPEELFTLLSETFRLPVAWPMSDYGSFESGGIGLGNVNLEVLRSTESPVELAPSRIIGFALEPEPLTLSLPELQARGIPYGTPAPYRSTGPDGSPATLWTTVGLPSVSHEPVVIFICQYEQDVAVSRPQLREQLRSRSGGPLTVLSVREVVYGAVDIEAIERQWESLLEPIEASSPGLWSVGDGPAIRVIRAAENRIQSIVISVASLNDARQFLVERDLLGTEQAGELTLASSELGGVNITLVEEGSL